MEGGYKTLRQAGAEKIIIKKSEFIGEGSPAADEAAALSFLQQIKQKYKDANHHCFAYVIGRNAGIIRYSDDGEPGGTAGQPILSVLRARGVVNACVVVTRYFGGVLLGASGLVRAYTAGAAAALSACGVVQMEDSVRFWAGVDYPLWGRVDFYLKTAPVLREEVDFGTTVTATLVARERDFDEVCKDIVRVTDGQAELLVIERLPIGWDEKGEGDAPPPL